MQPKPTHKAVVLLLLLLIQLLSSQANMPTTSDFEPEIRTVIDVYATSPTAINTTADISVADARFDKATRLLVLYIEIVVGALGGVFVVGWLCAHRRRKSRVDVIIWNLTLADILVICFACVMQVIWEHFDRMWLAGNIVCKLCKFGQSFSIMSSVNMLAVLSIDRHQAIRMPLHQPIPVHRLVGAGWLTAALLSLPQLGVFSVNVVDGRPLCESIFRSLPLSHRQAYLTYVHLVVFITPTVVMTTCYIRIFTKIASKAAEAAATFDHREWDITDATPGRRNASSPTGVQTAATAVADVRYSPAPDLIEARRTVCRNVSTTSSWYRKVGDTFCIKSSNWRSRAASRQRSSKVCLQSTQSGSLSRAKIKTLKMAVAIVTSFVVCSAPYHMLEMLYSYGQHMLVPSTVAGVLGAMAVANSATNPFIFLYFNVDCARLRQNCKAK